MVDWNDNRRKVLFERAYRSKFVEAMTSVSTNGASSVGGFVLASLGHLLVAASCLGAGFAASDASSLPTLIQLFEMSSFLLLIAPYFLSRNIFYERPANGTAASEQANPVGYFASLAFQLPFLIFALVGLQSGLALAILGSGPSGTESSASVAIRLVVCSVPFYMTGAWTFNPSFGEKSALFRYHSYFPSLLTCLLPFTYGWSMTRPILSLAIPCTVVVLLWFAAMKDRGRPLYLTIASILIFFALLLLSLILIPVDVGSEWAKHVQVYAFGVLLTAQMGICESWRVSTRIREGRGSYPVDPAKSQSESSTLYLNVTSLAVAVIPSLFLLTVMHPSTNKWYAFAVFVFFPLQTQLWFQFSDRWSSSKWNIAGLAVGYALPILVVFGTSFGRTVLPPFTPPPPLYVALPALVAFATFLVQFRSHTQGIKFKQLLKNHHSLIDKQTLRGLTGVVLLIELAIVTIGFLVLSLGGVVVSEVMSARAFMFQIMSVIYCIVLLWMLKLQQKP